MMNKKLLISLNTEVGNFKDCVQNLAYSMQKYIDCIHKYIPMVYKSIGKEPKECQQLIDFVFSEHEKILINNSLMIIIDSHKLLSRKLDSMIAFIDGVYYPNTIKKYKFKYDIFLKEYINNLDKDDILLKPNKNIDKELFHINKYIEKHSKIISDKIKTYDYIECDKETLVNKLKNIFNDFIEVTNKLEDFAKDSTSSFISIQIVKHELDILLIGYHILKSIKPVD